MSGPFQPSSLSRAAWDNLTGRNFYSSAGWLDFCATEHGSRVDAVVGDGVAVPVFTGEDLTGSSYDWNAKLAGLSLPMLATGGVLVGPREGYQTHLLRATPDPAPEAVAGLVADLRERAGADACVAMYMTSADVRLLRAAGVAAPPVLLECDAWMPVPEGGFDAWLAGLKNKRRYNVRQEMAAFAEAGYRIQHLPLRVCIDVIAPLAVATEAKYDYIATLDEDVASFRNHEQALGDAATVALCTLDDVPVGFCLYYVWQDTIFARWAGFDYPRLRDAFEYFNLLYYEQLRWAGERGVRWIHAGLKATSAKVLRGAVIRPLWMLDLGAESPLAEAAEAVHDHNAKFLDDLLADSTLGGALTDRADWDDKA